MEDRERDHRMSEDLIRRSDAIKVAKEFWYKPDIAGALAELPTIEPKRGEWKPFDLTWGRSIWYCTACEESTEVPCDIWEHKPIYKYCPNCGARMKGADDETD